MLYIPQDLNIYNYDILKCKEINWLSHIEQPERKGEKLNTFFTLSLEAEKNEATIMLIYMLELL